MSAALQLPAPTWFVGCGNMGGAILDGWRSGGLDLGSVTVIRPSGTPVEGTRTITSFADAGPAPKLVLLAFKPQKLDDIAPELRRHLSAETVVVSMLAGVEAESLRLRFPGVRAIVRAMPNLPVRIGKGAVGLCSDSEDIAAKALVTGLMATLGHAEWFDDETKFQLAGHLTGAGPAFLFRFIDALAIAAERLGLPFDQAQRLALKMVEGAAALAAASDDDPETLARKVASPGGTTEAGLAILDADRALLDLVERTLDASRARGLEMAAEARGR